MNLNTITTKLLNKTNIKISIITVCKNSEKFIEETIKSVIDQTYQQIEYIIIDGNSNDKTIAIVEKYRSHLKYFVSEDDGGMYNAINKGLKKATGDYILVLNSDDVLANSVVIENVVKTISEDFLEYYYGNMIKCKENYFKKVQLFNVSYKKLLLSTHGTFAPHPCFFISANLNKKIGGYDTRYRYASDYDYILKALSNAKGKHIPLYITVFRMHAGSITSSGKIETERKQILSAHNYYTIPSFYRVFIFCSLWSYYKLINLKFRFTDKEKE